MTTKPTKSRPPPTPKQPERWDRPPFPEKGDDDARNTFEWVGRALTEWETLEAYLGLIFGVFVGAGRDTEPAMRAYGSVTAFRGRADMLDAAAQAHFAKRPHPAMANFKWLMKDARGFSTRRNEIAHGVVQSYYTDIRQHNVGTVLGPSRHATSKQKLIPSMDQTEITSVPTYAYASAELMHFTRDFGFVVHLAKSFHRNFSRALKEQIQP